MASESFYPHVMPPHPGHPKRADFTIVNLADGKGRGLVAARPLAAGAVVAQLAGVVTPTPSLDTLQIGPELYMADPWFSRFLLHHCDPNCRVDQTQMRLMARRAIAPGERVTINYTQTEDRLGRQFECRCGAPDCQGWIMGRKETPNAEGQAFLNRRNR